MKEIIKNADQIIIALDDKIGAIIYDHKIFNFNFDEVEVEDMMEIISIAKQVKWGIFDVPMECPVYEYTIFNDGEYDFASHIDIHHKKFFSREEFHSMVQEAIDGECDSIYDVARWLKENKGFFHVQRATSCTADRPWRKEHEDLEDKFQILYK